MGVYTSFAVITCNGPDMLVIPILNSMLLLRLAPGSPSLRNQYTMRVTLANRPKSI